MNTGKIISRRKVLKLGTLGLAGAAGATALAQLPLAAAQDPTPTPSPNSYAAGHAQHGGMVMPNYNRDVDHAANGFNPSDTLTDFDYGEVSTLPDGRTLREYRVFSGDKDIEIAPGLRFPAWVYNGRMPGPTLRAREGDRLRIHFTNGSEHPHTMHFHGVHSANMDGVFEPVQPGDTFVYEFDAEPFGLHLYHCHVMPLARHIAKGLYGAFIIDPAQGRPSADREFVMVMHGIDVDYDDANDLYAVNGIPFHYHNHPIKVKVGELVRVYLVNILEFDFVNSFHLHANFFHYYPTGTSLTPSEYTDTIIQGQAQRGILEFRYKYPGQYMFHPHVTEFTELGWTGMFEVEEA
jgi:FtsP/CotA-like multicopper oxidase with cupredoxin domain